MGEKVGSTNNVFEKLCSSENTIFYSASTNTAIVIKSCMLKNRKCVKIVGCFGTWQKGVFVCFSQALM